MNKARAIFKECVRGIPKQKVFYFIARKCSTDSQLIKVTKNISFRRNTKSSLELDKRPIVLIYGWLVAKNKHIHKYGDYYMAKGFDVVHVKVLPGQLLWPVQTQAVVKSVLDFISDGERFQQPILSHGFSVGGYMYGETLVKIIDDPTSYGQVGRRLKGQVFDSPVVFSRIPEGFSKAVTDNVFLQKSLQYSLEGYLHLSYSFTSKHYLKAQDYFIENALRLPSLFLYSKSDKIAHLPSIENCIEGYKKKEVKVLEQCFEGSTHVSHFHDYPVQYITMLNKFIASLDLETEDVKAEDIKLQIGIGNA